MLFNHLETTEELGVRSLGDGDFHSLDACDRVVRRDGDTGTPGDGDRSPAVEVGVVFKSLGGAGGGGG